MEQKHKLTMEELSRIRSEAAKKRKNFNGGRPKGSKTRPELLKEKGKAMYIRNSDHYIYLRLAYASGKSLVEFMHGLALRLKEKNPDVFRTVNM